MDVMDIDSLINNPQSDLRENDHSLSHPEQATMQNTQAIATPNVHAEDCPEYIPIIVHPAEYSRFHHGPWTLDQDCFEGYYAPKEDLPVKIKTPKIEWRSILGNKNEYSTWTQHIMEHREAMLSPDEHSEWAKYILGVAVYGELTIQMRDRFGVTYDELLRYYKNSS